MEQIYHFYTECRKLELSNWKMDAMIQAQAAVYASPANDQSHARSKQKSWEKFMEGLTWEKLESKQKKKTSVTGFLGMFQRTGLIPIKKKKDGAK